MVALRGFYRRPSARRLRRYARHGVVADATEGAASPSMMTTLFVGGPTTASVTESIAIIPSGGQSLECGSDSDTQSAPINDYATIVGSYSGKTYRPTTQIRVRGTADPNSTSALYTPADVSKLITPADERYSASLNFTETGDAQMAQDLIDAEAYGRIVLVNAAWGAQAWSEKSGSSTDKDNLEWGTYHASNLIHSLRRMYDLTVAKFPNATVTIPYLRWNQGEAEIVEAASETQSQTDARIVENLQQLVDGITVEVRRITGNSAALPKVLVITKPLSGGADAAAQATSRRVASALTRACSIVQRVIAVDSEYVSANYTDGTHKTATGYNINGNLFATAILRDQNSEPIVPLHVTSVAQTASLITLTTDATSGLEQDTSTVSAVTDDGFEVWSNDLSTQRTLTSVVYNGADIELNGSSFASDDHVRFALEDRGAAIDPVGGNCVEDVATRPRWLSPFQINDLSAFSAPSATTDPTHIRAHSNRTAPGNPRTLTTYSHSWGTTEEAIASASEVICWIKADAALRTGGIIHDFAKKQCDGGAMQGTLTTTTIGGVEYFTGFSATAYIDWSSIIPVDGPLSFAIRVQQPHSATARRILGVSYRGSSDCEWALDLITRRARYHVDSGLNSFSANGPQHADDGAGHLHIVALDSREPNYPGKVVGKLDSGSWTNMGNMTATTEHRNINHTFRIGNGAGDFEASDTELSDCIVMSCKANAADHADLIADIESLLSA